MRKRFNDLTGQKFGRLTAKKRLDDYISPAGYHSQRWLCHCECGKEVAVLRSNLVKGSSASCGCLRHEIQIANGRWKGCSSELLHYVWRSMCRRCSNPLDKGYKRYGGRGVKVCAEWQKDYFTFKEWAEKNGYQKGLSIDRIDPNGNYEPDNCRWVSVKVQNTNKRNTDFIEFNGEIHPLSVWAVILGIPYKTLRGRLYMYGKTVEEAFSTPNNLSRRKQ